MSLPIAFNLDGYLSTLLFAIVLCVPYVSFIMRHSIYWIHLYYLVLNILYLLYTVSSNFCKYCKMLSFTVTNIFWSSGSKAVE